MTPVDADRYEELLLASNYNKRDRTFLVDVFRNGFDLGFRGSIKGLRRFAPNLKIRVGSETILWNKVMKEVKNLRYAGPFKEVPFENFIQSPVGLVPKDGNDTRLIFHLSYPRNGMSVNSATLRKFCKVVYCDFADAIRKCLEVGASCKIGKSDMKSAFRNLGISVSQFCLLILKARNPMDGKYYFFVDKCLPFGSSASCFLFQKFSDSIAHIAKFRASGNRPVNYLDDYLFAAYMTSLCKQRIQEFLDICGEIGFLVAMEKTFWATTMLVFLGILIDTVNQTVSIPREKIMRAQALIDEVLGGRKTTVRRLQKLCGFLNFLCKCIIPGRAFTRRLYSYYNSTMPAHYHINVNAEMRKDLNTWRSFLAEPEVYCRPFIDFTMILQAREINWYTDASGVIGIGGIFNQHFYQQKWDSFALQVNPSIQYKELLAVVASVLLWGKYFRNRRIKLFVDNSSVEGMVNHTTSGCKNCMVLIRILVLHCMKLNLRVFAKHVSSKDNFLADALSRFQMDKFYEDIRKDGRTLNGLPDVIPNEIWPIEKIWIK